jgi:endonuclease/exonuclease/phosphatase family metal-dependent hydrolase
MSFNIRVKEKENPLYAWQLRRDNVAKLIRSHNMDLIGLQEPTIEQMRDLEMLLPEFAWYGEPINIPINAILYRKSAFNLVDKSHFFLSQTPSIPSIGWDAKFVRGVCWVKLKDKKSNNFFYFFNTHFDYHGQAARDESAYLLREKVAEIYDDLPFIISGDFNLFPDLGGKETYRILTQDSISEKDVILFDAQHKSLFPHYGPTGTWSGFKEAGQPGIKPDCIFISDKLSVISHGVLSDTYNGDFPSDHLPVVSEIDFD